MDPLMGPPAGMNASLSVCISGYVSIPDAHTYFTKQGSCVAFLSRNCM